MEVVIPEGLRLTSDNESIRPKRFDSYAFKSPYVIPPAYPNVEETIRQFPDFANCKKGVVLFAWSYNTGFNNVYNFVQRSPEKDGKYFANMTTGSGCCPAVKESEVKSLVKEFQESLVRDGMMHKEVEPDKVSFNMRKSKENMISTMKIEPNFSFAAFPEGLFGYAVLVEAQDRKYPSPNEIKEDVLGIAKIADVAREVFSEYFAKNSPWMD